VYDDALVANLKIWHSGWPVEMDISTQREFIGSMANPVVSFTTTDTLSGFDF